MLEHPPGFEPEPFPGFGLVVTAVSLSTIGLFRWFVRPKLPELLESLYRKQRIFRRRLWLYKRRFRDLGGLSGIGFTGLSEHRDELSISWRTHNVPRFGDPVLILPPEMCDEATEQGFVRFGGAHGKLFVVRASPDVASRLGLEPALTAALAALAKWHRVVLLGPQQGQCLIGETIPVTATEFYELLRPAVSRVKQAYAALLTVQPHL